MDQNNKMTPLAEQAETENAEQRIRALEEREAALDLRERTARCRAELQGRDLPDSLTSCVLSGMQVFLKENVKVGWKDLGLAAYE